MIILESNRIPNYLSDFVTISEATTHYSPVGYFHQVILIINHFNVLKGIRLPIS